jgi:hypothetical protein
MITEILGLMSPTDLRLDTESRGLKLVGLPTAGECLQVRRQSATRMPHIKQGRLVVVARSVFLVQKSVNGTCRQL